MIVVVGVDPSQTASGLCDGTRCVTIGRPGHRDDSYEVRGRRMQDTAHEVTAWVLARSPVLVGVESPALGAGGRRTMQYGDFDRAALWWLIVNRLLRDFPVAFIHPKKRAKYATGNGNAKKPEVWAAAQRLYPHLGMANNNEGDAAILAAMCAHQLGEPWPIAGGTLFGAESYQETSLREVDWPELVR